jgi:octaprenyl-diphosphate synthase
VLRHAAASHPSSAPAHGHLNEIESLLGESLPALEAAARAACDGPSPLDEAARHLVTAGGKRIRPLTTLLVTRACGGDTKRAVPLAAAAEIVHSATLLHDDVIDDGVERRGRPASRVLWGNRVSVLSGDLLLTSALELVQASGVPGAMTDTLATMQALIAGEAAQIEARGRDDIGIDGYLRIARGKTASLFACACRFGARVASAPDEVITAAGRFGERVGIAFQIVDDTLDIEGVPHEVGKQLGRDIAEGKTTLPLALALGRAAADLRPLLIDARAGDTLAATKVAQSPAVREACAEARAFAARETAAGMAELARLPEGRPRRLLEELVRGLTERRA